MRCNKGSWHAILVGLAVLVLIAFLTSCAASWKPAKQQKDHTPNSTITVTQADTNKDGNLDTSEIQALTPDKPSVITTFMCIGGLVVAVCGLCVILSRSRHNTTADMGTFTTTSDSSEQDLDDDEHWCHAEQDFLGDPSGTNVGKRRE